MPLFEFCMATVLVIVFPYLLGIVLCLVDLFVDSVAELFKRR